jgi:hypothetical protein
LKSPLPSPLLRASALLALALFAGSACTRRAAPSTPTLSDPVAGLAVELPPAATSFARAPAAKDRFVSRVPYADRQTLLYLHLYSIPSLGAADPTLDYDDRVETIFRHELGAFLTLQTTPAVLPDQTPALLLFGRARDPDFVVGFAFQCNKTHFVFIGLSGPDLAPADAQAFFDATAPNLQIAPVPNTTFADAAEYQHHFLSHSDPAQFLDFVRNLFASRNTNPANYPLSISLAYLFAQNLLQSAPDAPQLSEALGMLNNMDAIRLDDYLQARLAFEIALGQRQRVEAIAQARRLAALVFPFDSEGSSLAKKRLRQANAIP